MQTNKPLSQRIRPRKVDEIYGQPALETLKNTLEKGNLHSLILWGPPGVGKTTIALAISQESQASFEKLSAVGSGIKDLREVIKRAEANKEKGLQTILFIDEIHRWNKSQQDALLPHVENGDIYLIGATTENPNFEVNPALLSRTKLYTLKQLDENALNQIIDHACQSEKGFNGKIELSEEAREVLLLHANGDARRALNGLERAYFLQEEGLINKEKMAEALGKTTFQYSKTEDHYNTTSAFIKSIRGSDANAALYYLARMERGGEDPKFVARRLIILASEDIGMARPGALAMANSCFDAVLRVGPPECWINLAHLVVYLSQCPKDWKSYLAWKRAQDTVDTAPQYPIPEHLHNKPPRNLLSSEKYVHASKENKTTNFLPKELQNKKFLEEN